jgi:hypothetical protein
LKNFKVVCVQSKFEPTCSQKEIKIKFILFVCSVVARNGLIGHIRDELARRLKEVAIHYLFQNITPEIIWCDLENKRRNFSQGQGKGQGLMECGTVDTQYQFQETGMSLLTTVTTTNPILKVSWSLSQDANSGSSS